MKTVSSRLFSLDVFRGMTIALMITVNIPGSWEFIYPPLEHAEWHGCTPTDLVFPFFLFIVGVSAAFSFYRFNYILTSESVFKIIERTFLIFTVGFMLNNFPFFSKELSGTTVLENGFQIMLRIILGLIPFLGIIWIIKKTFSVSENYVCLQKNNLLKLLLFAGLIIFAVLLLFLLPASLYNFEYYNRDFSEIRIMGVLQRIALAYGAGAIIILAFKKKYIPFITIFILLLYWFIMWYFGGNDPYSLEGNFGRKIDIMLLGEDHMWMGKGIPFDPEGIVSTLPSIGTVLIGFLSGMFILDNKGKKQGWLFKFLIAGGFLVITGMIWDFAFPINKPLWTSSYVLYTGGLAILVLSLLYWLIDVLDYKKFFTFFRVFGVNPLFAFALHVIWVKIISGIIRWRLTEDETANGYGWLYHNIFQKLAGDHNGSLLFAVAHIVFFYLILLILYNKKIFIKI